jgi:hypothetical protein
MASPTDLIERQLLPARLRLLEHVALVHGNFVVFEGTEVFLLVVNETDPVSHGDAL